MESQSWNVVVVGNFNERVSRIKSRCPRVDEFIIGAKILLEKDPRIGKQTKRKEIRALPMAEVPGCSPIVLYYFIADNNDVLLLDIKMRDDNNPHDFIM